MRYCSLRGEVKQFGKLLPEYRQAYANEQRELYPKNLWDMDNGQLDMPKKDLFHKRAPSKFEIEP